MIQSDNANIIKSKQILKNLNAILKFSIERYNHQFVWQEIELKDEFKSAFRDVILKKGGELSRAVCILKLQCFCHGIGQISS